MKLVAPQWRGPLSRGQRFLLLLPILYLLGLELRNAWAQRTPGKIDPVPAGKRPAESFTGDLLKPIPAAAKPHRLELKVTPSQLDARTRAYAFKPAGKPDVQGSYIVPDNRFRVVATAPFTPAKSYSRPWVELKNARYMWRSTPNGAWQQVTLSTSGYGIYAESWDFQSHRQLSCRVEPNLPNSGEWIATGQLEMWTRNNDNGEWWQGRIEFNQHWFVRKLPAGQYPERYSKVEPKLKPLIAKLQYEITNRHSWRDVPMPGQPGYPLKLRTGDWINFRAVKRFPNEPWPLSDNADSESADYYPFWHLKSEPNRELSQYSAGQDSSMWQIMIPPPDDKRPYRAKLTATAGNSVTADFIFNGDRETLPEPQYKISGQTPKQWLVHLEYGVGLNPKLKRVPVPGEAGFPLRVPLNSTFYLGAIYTPYKKGQNVPIGNVIVEQRPSQKDWQVDNNSNSGFSRVTTEGGELLRLNIEPSDVIDGDSASVGDFIVARLVNKRYQDPSLFATLQVVGNSPSVPPPAPIHIARLRKLQIADTDAREQKWRDLPMPGQPGYPLGVMVGHIYVVQAVFDRVPDWNFYEKIGISEPYWRGSLNGKVSDLTGKRMVIDAFYTLKSTGQKYSISVRSLGTLATAVKATPDYEAIGRAKAIELRDAQARAASHLRDLRFELRLGVKTTVSNAIYGISRLALKHYALPVCQTQVELYGLGTKLDSRWRLRLSALHDDGKPAGQINGPGPQDDYFTRQAGGMGVATLRADDIRGRVTLSAEVLGTHGEVMARAASFPIYFDDLRLEVKTGPWQASDIKPMTWQRDVTPFAFWSMDKSSASSAIGELPVKLSSGAPDAASRKSISLSRTLTTTAGRSIGSMGSSSNRVQQIWTWSPDASRELNGYPLGITWGTPAGVARGER